MSLVESLAAVFEAAWTARPKDATGLRVSVDGRDQAHVRLRYQVARVPKEPAGYLARELGFTKAIYERVCRGSEPSDAAQSDDVTGATQALKTLATGVSRAVFFEEVKRAFSAVRPRVGDSWLVVWRGGLWDQADQERFETLNPHWRPDG